ncbi:hypothetical protein JCM11251_001385 [Rhodosporidiobolus azoricus]
MRPGLSRSASVIVTSRKPSLRVETEEGGTAAAAGKEQGGKRARPITFALPPTTAGPSKAPHLSSSTSSAPLLSSPTNPTSSFFNRISRKLSQSRSTLVRRVSIGKGASGKTASSSSAASAVSATHSSPPSPEKSRSGNVLAATSEADKENAAPPSSAVSGLSPPRVSKSRPGLGQRTSSHTPSTSSALARAARQEADAEDMAPRVGRAPLKRGTRVSVMRRTKSEGQRKGRILNEEGKMEELVRRTEEAGVSAPAVEDGDGAQGGAAGMQEHTPARRGDWEEVHSSMGSYFWSDSLGVCWDGREKVHPDLLFSFQPYSSNSDVLPPHLQEQQTRIVYASTLSSFPPRPPLRPRTPELTEASKIIVEWRKVNGTMTPSVHGDEGGLETIVGSEQDTPRPLDADDHPLAATPAERELVNEPAPVLQMSTTTVRPRPSFATLPAVSNPFASPPASSIPLSSSPAYASSPSAAENQRRLLASVARPLSLSSFISGGTSAYSTPTSEPGQFHFQSCSDREGEGEEGGLARGGSGGEEGFRGVRLSSEGSETSLESIAAVAAKGRAE